ncbi:hypothetical protein C8R43DRAFT_270461 [Mycena crocata]|nr:hypothetical protein C8R43DRAFT_270461 [Mycena crocata]
MITKYLHGSPADLKSCTLTARPLKAYAQRHLFHDIIFNPGCPDVDHPTTRKYNELARCRRFWDMIKASSEPLASYVRRLWTSLEDGVLRELVRVKFPNLRDVLFHRDEQHSHESIKKKTLAAAGRIIGLPSVRRVGLLWLTFRDMRDSHSLFDQCSSHLEALLIHQVRVKKGNSTGVPLPSRRAVIKQLQLLSDEPPMVLLSRTSPFDFAHLRDIEYCIANRRIFIDALLTRSQVTITGIKITLVGRLDYEHITYLAHLPHLTDIEVASDDVAAMAFIRALTSSNRLETMSIHFPYFGTELGTSLLNDLRTALTAHRQMCAARYAPR